MARVTIEDCLEQVPNRFGLVVMVGIRTKQLMRGARPLVQAAENRTVVTALREVAAGLVRPDVDLEAQRSEAEGEPSAE
ncbi:MAG: DNA-directed RNA polymerase subunit omega [Myxococcota bacterium]